MPKKNFAKDDDHGFLSGGGTMQCFPILWIVSVIKTCLVYLCKIAKSIGNSLLVFFTGEQVWFQRCFHKNISFSSSTPDLDTTTTNHIDHMTSKNFAGDVLDASEQNVVKLSTANIWNELIWLPLLKEHGYFATIHTQKCWLYCFRVKSMIQCTCSVNFF